MERFFIHDTKHKPGFAMYLLKEGIDVVLMEYSRALFLTGGRELCCRFPFQAV